jgi:GT2 family glycosyltransferase
VNWSGREHTVACLEVVSAQCADVPGAMITVVDNGSTDGSIGTIIRRFPNVRLLPLGSNHGFTGGIAAGLARSPAQHVIFLNNDAVPQPGWLAALSAAIDRAPADIISIGGKIVDMSGENIDFVGGVMTFDGHAFQNGFRFPVGTRREPENGAELFFACGGNMISRREPLMALGGFDDDYFAYLEDVDFGWRSWIAGHRVLYESRAVVRHASAATSNRLGDFERGVLFERNALQTVLKNYEDQLLHEFAGTVFFAYLHRLHHYTTTRNGDAGELVREPLSAAASRGNGFWRRLRRRVQRDRPLATIDDPLTAMQFRAFEWIVRHADRIAAKREAVQRLRRRSDREIFERFPLHVVPTYPGDEELLRSPLFRLLRPSMPAVEKKLGDIIRTGNSSS